MRRRRRWDRVVGPSLVAHGLPGGRFSTNDAVAALHARKACPSRPSVVVARGETPPGATKPLIDDGQTANGPVARARAWGVPSKDIVAALERDCTERGPLGKCEEADERRPGECRNRYADRMGRGGTGGARSRSRCALIPRSAGRVPSATRAREGEREHGERPGRFPRLRRSPRPGSTWLGFAIPCERDRRTWAPTATPN